MTFDLAVTFDLHVHVSVFLRSQCLCHDYRMVLLQKCCRNCSPTRCCHPVNASNDQCSVTTDTTYTSTGLLDRFVCDSVELTILTACTCSHRNVKKKRQNCACGGLSLDQTVLQFLQRTNRPEQRSTHSLEISAEPNPSEAPTSTSF